MNGPAVPDPDDKDWTWVLERPCSECGFIAYAVPRNQLSAEARTAVATLQTALARDDAPLRPSELVWSPLEYACHVRDVCLIFHGRLQLLLDEDDPLFANWDQDETALAKRYWEQEPAVVADELNQAAAAMDAEIDGVGDDQWTRAGRRSNGSQFTVETLIRYYLHDLVHHAYDVRPVSG
jgi:DinB superfamily